MINDLGIDIDALMNLPPEAQQELMRLLALHKEATILENSRSQFHDYIERVWGTDEPFIDGAHIRHIAKIVDRMISGEGKKRIIINMPPRHMKPVWVEEKVWTKRGQIRLADVVAGDMVLTHLGRYRTVMAVHEQGDLDTVVISTHHGRHVRMAPDHPVLTPRGWVEAGSLLEGEALCVPCGVGSHSLISSGEARLLGYLIGDGNVTGNGTEVTSFDEEVTDDVIWAAESMGFGANRSPSTKGRINIRGAMKWSREHDIRGRNSHTKVVPECILNGDTEAMRHFVAAYFACDGTLNTKGKTRKDLIISFTSVSRELLRGTRDCLAQLGISSRIRTRTHNHNKWVQPGYKFFVLDITGQDNVARFAEHIPVAGAKKKKLTDWVPVRKEFDAGFVTDYVVSVSPAGRAPCRCITVAEDSSFTAGGIAVHNSRMFSVMLPSYYLGKYPYRKIIQASNVSDLAIGFGRNVRDIIRSKTFQEIFPSVDIKADVNAAGRWNTNKQGEYYAVGAEGNVTGRGGHLIIIDDPHSDYQITNGFANPKVFDSTFDWFVGTLRQRLMPGGFIIICQTRFSKRDLTGRILEWAKNNGTLDQWEVVEFPAILPSGKNLWPEFWTMQDMEEAKRDMPPSKWTSQYMQRPSVDEGAIIKKDTWRPWPNEFEPDCEYIIQSWDTAFSAKDTANYSACTTWGIFKHHNHKTGKPEKAAILLKAWRDRVEFPMLKKKAREFYLDCKPDTVIVEAKATGTPLIFELQQQDIPVSEYNPGRGADKITRVNSVSDLFSSGRVWYMPNVANEIVVDEFTDFPTGAYDDLVDSSTQALMRFRQGLFIETENDIYDDEEEGRVVRDHWGYY